MVQNDSTRAVYVTLTVARRRTVKALHLQSCNAEQSGVFS